jgi:hypothetical protein
MTHPLALCTVCLCRMRSFGVANPLVHAFMVHLKGRVWVFMCMLLDHQNNVGRIVMYLHERKTYFSNPRLWYSLRQCLHCSEETLSAAKNELWGSDFDGVEITPETQSSSFLRASLVCHFCSPSCGCTVPKKSVTDRLLVTYQPLHYFAIL